MTEKFPHIRDYRAFKVPPISDAKFLVKCQLAVATFNCKHLLFLFPFYLLMNNELTFKKKKKEEKKNR